MKSRIYRWAVLAGPLNIGNHADIKHEQKESAQNRLLLEFREQSNEHRRERKEIEYIFEPNANVPTVNRLTNKLNNQSRLEGERIETASDRRLRTVTMAM